MLFTEESKKAKNIQILSAEESKKLTSNAINRRKQKAKNMQLLSAEESIKLT